jgi:hypothetical protein
LGLRACWPWSRPLSGCGRSGLAAVREVGRNVSGCSGAPQLAASPGGVPCWEAFPEVNRGLVAGLLGLLAERMMAPVTVVGGRGGGERDERAGRAAGAARGQGRAAAP